MRVACVVLVVVATLLGCRAETTVATASDQTTVSQTNWAEPTTIYGNRHSQTKNAVDEERAASITIAKVDELVDPSKLNAALKDLTTRMALFKQWNVDASVWKQVIKRLSGDAEVFAKYSPLVLMFNGYRVKQVAKQASKLAQRAKVDALVDPVKLDAALKDSAKMKALFKQWDADEAMAMKVVQRLASDTDTFAKYSTLVLHFNSYRTKLLRRAS
jgi:hypothetical protein